MYRWSWVRLYKSKILAWPSKQLLRHHHNQLVFTELSSRSLIRVSGPESFPFLQGLITNDINNLQSQPSIFTVFLNQGGRVLFDSLLFRSSENSILIECDSHVQQSLIRHLKLYRIRRNVQIDDVAKTLKPWVVWDPTHQDIPAAVRRLVASSCCDTSDHQTRTGVTHEDLHLTNDVLGICDPRLESLGWRVILPSQDKNIETKDTQLSVERSTEVDYKILLYALGVGEGFVDFPIANSFPLESNVDFLHGVNFHKGCYIGQELTARTHHTGVVRKRLLPFRIPEDVKFPSEVDKSTLQILNQAGKPVAKVRNIVKSYGLALTRINEALSSTELKLGDHLVQLEKPCWWPTETSQEKQDHT